MKIDITDLEVDIKYDYVPPTSGGSHDDGTFETFPSRIIITSIVAKGIEILPILHPDEVEILEQKVRELDYGLT